LSEYAYRLWQGLISEYYVPRWTFWLQGTAEALQTHTIFDNNNFTTSVLNWQENWIFQRGNPFPQEPNGLSAQVVASQIYQRYFAE
jgi:hypothetical protein